MMRHISCSRERMRSPMRSPKGFLLRGILRGFETSAAGVAMPLAFAKIWEVGGDNGRAIVVVAGVQDQADRVPDPFGGFDGAEFVEHQHFGFEHGRRTSSSVAFTESL